MAVYSGTDSVPVCETTTDLGAYNYVALTFGSALPTTFGAGLGERHVAVLLVLDHQRHARLRATAKPTPRPLPPTSDWRPRALRCLPPFPVPSPPILGGKGRGRGQTGQERAARGN